MPKASSEGWSELSQGLRRSPQDPLDEMKSQIIMVGGLLMAVVSVSGLVSAQPYLWIVCPHALAVMFIRQSLHAYDSLGAADLPEIVVAALYYPVIATLLLQTGAHSRFGRVFLGIAISHVVVVALALACVGMRNRMWGFP